MLIHIPHSSRFISGLVKMSNERENLNSLTDDYVDEIFDYSNCAYVRFPFSRFVCDVERLYNDPMEEIGQGIIYKKDIYGNDIERIISDESTMMMYKIHHRYFGQQVNFLLGLFDSVPIVDAHTFTPTEDDHPDICIGTNDFHTPKKLIGDLFSHFNKKEYSTKINYPYSGTIVPSHLYNKEKRVKSIMLEINKTSYIKDKEKMKITITEALEVIDE